MNVYSEASPTGINEAYSHTACIAVQLNFDEDPTQI